MVAWGLRVPNKAARCCHRAAGNKFDKQKAKKSDKPAPILNDAGLLEGHKSPILVDGLECAAAQFDAYKLVKFWYPDALDLKIWRNRALDHFGDMATDPALLFGQTRPVNSAAGADAGASDATNTCHDVGKGSGGAGGEGWLPDLSRQAESSKILLKSFQSRLWRRWLSQCSISRKIFSFCASYISRW